MHGLQRTINCAFLVWSHLQQFSVGSDGSIEESGRNAPSTADLAV